jgi:hypothetical protein
MKFLHLLFFLWNQLILCCMYNEYPYSSSWDYWWSLYTLSSLYFSFTTFSAHFHYTNSLYLHFQYLTPSTTFTFQTPSTTSTPSLPTFTLQALFTSQSYKFGHTIEFIEKGWRLVSELHTKKEYPLTSVNSMPIGQPIGIVFILFFYLLKIKTRECFFYYVQ